MMKLTTTVLLTVSLLAACTISAISPLTEQNPSATTASLSIVPPTGPNNPIVAAATNCGCPLSVATAALG